MKTTKNLNFPLYFTFRELITTSTGLNNFPVESLYVFNLFVLGHSLDYIREQFGRTIFVNSAFRTAEVNKVVGGSPRSYHLQGLAADIRPMSVNARLLGDSSLTKEQATDAYLQELDILGSICLALKNDGLLVEYIPYENFVHIAISDKMYFMMFEKMFNDK